MPDSTSRQAGEEADLERLGAELVARGFRASLVARPGRRPYLHIQNPRAAAMTERIYTQDDFFVWPWNQAVARRDQIAATADAIARVLRTLSSEKTCE